jgi:hypothetical protein
MLCSQNVKAAGVVPFTWKWVRTTTQRTLYIGGSGLPQETMTGKTLRAVLQSAD